jgi:hypothetical protein
MDMILTFSSVPYHETDIFEVIMAKSKFTFALYTVTSHPPSIFTKATFSVGGAIRCIHDIEEKNNQTVKQCNSNYRACSVLWTGPTAKEAEITSRACWNQADTYTYLNNCPFGPCVPHKIEVKRDGLTTSVYNVLS